MPVGYDDADRLVVAMADPGNVFALDDIRQVTGLDARPVVATREDLLAAIDRDGRIAVATVVRQTGSAPRSIGTSMAVDAAGAVIGSISGGCVEGAAYETCAGVLATGVAARTDYGYSDDDAFAVGLSCGGRLDVVTTLLTAELLAAEPRLRQALEAAAAGRPAAIDLVTDTAAPAGGSSPLGRVLPAAEPVPGERSRLADVRCDGEPVTALRIVAATPPVLLVYGAVDFGAALAAHAQLSATGCSSSTRGRCSRPVLDCPPVSKRSSSGRTSTSPASRPTPTS
jgi:xanthine dehydrogenase accessory factor